MLRDASWVVTALPSREPPEQGLKVDEEEERGECVALDGAVTHSHRSVGEASGFIELDTAECASVQVSHNAGKPRTCMICSILRARRC